jgi:ribosomal protein S18 acetylase RimI-like enzyme
MHYRFLTESDFSTLYQTHLEAFSDYIVDLSMSEQQFQQRLLSNGVRLNASVGAFDGGQMVGFTVNGLDLWNNQPTAYDAGTGVVPSHRGKGIAKGLFHFMLPRLTQQGVRQYLLEVISSNEPAVRLYRQLGFQETRRLAVLKRKAPLERLPDLNKHGAAVLELQELDWQLFQSFWDASPSWQNSIESIKRSVTQKISLGAYVGENLVGYCVVSTSSGNIAQLAVDRNHRRQGIGSLLLATLQTKVEAGKPLQMQNLDCSLKGALAFYEARGFKRVLDQYEMMKTL